MDKSKILNKKELSQIKSIRNREGEVITFNLNKIIYAIYKAFIATGEGTEKEAESIAKNIFYKLIHLKEENKGKKFVPSVEMIQDLVEAELMGLKFYQTAKSYILYRSNRAKLRQEVGVVPPESKNA